MRILILFIAASCLHFAHAQHTHDSLRNARRNQFDVGFNFSYFFDRYGLAIDHDVASFPNDREFTDLLGAFHFGYKREFGKNFCALVNYQNFEFAGRTFNKYLAEKEPVRGDLLWRSGYKYIGAGAGYMIKRDRFQSVFSLQLAYAANDLGGIRTIFWGYGPNGYTMKQDLPQSIHYKDEYGFGISPSADVNFFVYKNIGIGCNLFVNYFPFAESTFIQADKYVDNLTEEDIAKYNKPAKLLISSNVKLAYRFKDPKFLRKT